MQLPAARKGDKTRHGGQITNGFSRVLIGGKPAARIEDMHSCPLHEPGPVDAGSPTVLIGGFCAARKTDTATCWVPPGVRPDPLKAADILASATLFTKSPNPKALLNFDKDKRREFLKQMALDDFSAGKSSLEIFSNTVQRSLWANVLSMDRRAAVGSDVGLIFSIFETPMDQPLKNRNEKYNINFEVGAGKELPFTGFSERYRNDDGDPEQDQTHHLAFYTMVGSSRWPNFLGDLGGWYHDRGHPKDQELAYAAVEFGSKLGDDELDVNAWIWEHFGGGLGADVIDDGCPTVLIGTSR